MKSINELRQQLGSGYVFQKYMGNCETARLQKSNPAHFTDTTVAVLIAGCVRIDAVLFQTGAGLRLGYDVFVKDDPNSPEWICYDNLSDPVSLKEADMLAVLDRVVRMNNLSYTECSFERLNGKVIITGKKKAEVTGNV